MLIEAQGGPWRIISASINQTVIAGTLNCVEMEAARTAFCSRKSKHMQNGICACKWWMICATLCRPFFDRMSAIAMERDKDGE
ncbi:hypothetical protein CEXT_286591 [Caerostris extrusa]|uniref:Uncharacterized protein n=1 Tax=Caerostris extrusa TaxID=172846 RepID=A0AAV4S5Z0_CAEEX|nr:hypothetical protein CEXT_286591 [Caerostris extrusa]